MSTPERARALRYATTLQRTGRPPRATNRAFDWTMALELTRRIHPHLPPEEQEQQARLVVEHSRQAVSPELPHEDQEFLAVIRDRVGEVEQAAAALEVSVPRSPIFASLDTGDINAVTVRVPGTAEHVVFLETELMLFAMLFTKAVAHALPYNGHAADGRMGFSTNPARVRERIRADPSVLRRFREVVLAYVVDGRPSSAPSYLAEPHHIVLATNLLLTLERFVVGHEYTHVSAGHLTGAATRRGLADDPDAEIVEFAWHDEFEADVLGLELSILASHRSGDPIDYAFWGAELYFSAMTAVEGGVYALTGRRLRGRLGTHPPTELRVANLRRAYRVLVGEERGAHAEALARMNDLVVVELFDALRPELARLREAGVRPAPRWGQDGP